VERIHRALLIVLWLLKKVAGMLFKRAALGLFGIKARVLRGAAMTIHSIKSIPRPLDRASSPETGEALVDEDGNATPSAQTPGPKDYVKVDVTITPLGSISWPVSPGFNRAPRLLSFTDA